MQVWWMQSDMQNKSLSQASSEQWPQWEQEVVSKTELRCDQQI